MAITLQQILDQTNDYLGSYTTSTLDPGAKTRAINRSIEYIKRRLGFPSDETIQTFNFTEDQFFYDLNDDFDEALQLVYHDPLLNFKNREWDYFPYQELLQKTGDGSISFRWSHTTVNGKNQLMMLGQNLKRGTLIESFDSVGNWVASGDASSLTTDVLIKYLGDAALKFTGTYSSGSAILTNSSESLDFQSYFEQHGILKLWIRIPDIDVTNVKIKIYNDNSNYWTITETTQDDGTAFAINEWIKLGFALDDAVQTGSPDYTDTITKISITFTITSSFSTGTIRVDHMFMAIPDSMDLIYYTRYKGQNSSGTDLILLSSTSDTLRIGDYFDDYIDVIARRSALSLSPQARGDKDFYATYVEDFKEMMKTLGKSFPRKRVMNNFLRHELKR